MQSTEIEAWMRQQPLRGLLAAYMLHDGECACKVCAVVGTDAAQHEQQGTEGLKSGRVTVQDPMLPSPMPKQAMATNNTAAQQIAHARYEHTPRHPQELFSAFSAGTVFLGVSGGPAGPVLRGLATVKPPAAPPGGDDPARAVA